MCELNSWAHIWCVSGFVLKTRCYTPAEGIVIGPLDGSTLTHWGACAPARGPAAVPHSSSDYLVRPLRTPPVREKRRGEKEPNGKI